MILPSLRQITSGRFKPFRRRRQARADKPWHPGHSLTLADIPAGQPAMIVSFLAGLPDERQAHLHAYGLAPGSRVQVKQHQPVTVIQVDHIELALETSLALKVSVRRLP